MLGPRTTMRVGGPARVYAEPATTEDLRELLVEANRRSLPVYLLGRGSNLIIPDVGVEGLVINLAHPSWQKFEMRPEGRAWAGAGLRLKNLCGLATKAGLQGFEFLEGIPGSVGGALRMNAGAMGGWMFDLVEEVHLMSLAGEVRVMKKSAMHVDYRHCAELHEAVALGALLKPAATAESHDIRRQIDVYRANRAPVAFSKTRQAFPPAGSSTSSDSRGCGWGTPRYRRCMRTSSSIAGRRPAPTSSRWSARSAPGSKVPEPLTLNPRCCSTGRNGGTSYEFPIFRRCPLLRARCSSRSSPGEDF